MGWGRLTADAQGAQPRFRLPTLNDQIAVAGAADAPRALARRCIEPYPLSAKLAAHVETALAAYAPPLAGPLHGRCPDCDATIEARFEARRYCLQELGYRAQFVYDDVDILAGRYHWSERAILAMPYARRTENRSARPAAGRHAWQGHPISRRSCPRQELRQRRAAGASPAAVPAWGPARSLRCDRDMERASRPGRRQARAHAGRPCDATGRGRGGAAGSAQGWSRGRSRKARQRRPEPPCRRRAARRRRRRRRLAARGPRPASSHRGR